MPVQDALTTVAAQASADLPCPPTSTVSPLPLLSYREIITGGLPPVDWLVDGLIGNQDRVVLYGEFGSLKSWLLLDLAIALAEGRQWMGQFRIPRSRKVLYVDEEMSQHLVRRRVKQLSLSRASTNGDLPFRALNLFGVRFNSEDATRKMLTDLTTAQFDPDVIIVETLRRVMSGDENDASAVSEFWRNVRPIQQAGKTLIVTHHMRKKSAHASNESRERASGSTDIIGGADGGIAVKRMDPTHVQLECVKVRHAEELPKFSATFARGEVVDSLRFQFERFLTSEASQTLQQHACALIVEFLSVGGHQLSLPREIKAFVVEERHIRPRTYERAWQYMRETGRVEQHGQYWALRTT